MTQKEDTTKLTLQVVQLHTVTRLLGASFQPLSNYQVDLPIISAPRTIEVPLDGGMVLVEEPLSRVLIVKYMNT